MEKAPHNIDLEATMTEEEFLKTKAWPWVKRIILGVVLPLILFAIFKPWGYVENYELGYRFNGLDGKITVLDRPGYHWRTPWVESINTIDLRPTQVCINANSRVLNCKLVRFNPDKEHQYAGMLLFISWHGRGDYSISQSSGDGSSHGGLNDILMSYAYDGSARSYPFLTIMKELKADESVAVAPVVTSPPAPQPSTKP
jgi:hypothetical protein